MSQIVNLACGLANRMFQYSYYLFLLNKGFDVEVDAYESGALAHERVEWDRIFPHATYPSASHINVFLKAGGNDIISRARRKFRLLSPDIVQMPSAYDVKLPEKNGCYIIGVFQSASMVETVAAQVHKVFEFSPIEDAYNKNIAQEIASCEAVAIHVRKGKDYQSRVWYQNTCPLDYYKCAVDEIKRQVDNPRFFVFCDNKQWVKENFRWLDYTLVDGNPGVGYGCHFDMQLMSMCNHNIISNSTYSWWGAYLNAHQNKIVILPRVWFNPDSTKNYTSEPLMCSGWEQL